MADDEPGRFLLSERGRPILAAEHLVLKPQHPKQSTLGTTRTPVPSAQ